MNKIIVALILLILITGGLFFYFNQVRDSNKTNIIPTPAPLVQQDEKKQPDFEPASEINGYQIKSLLIRDASDIHLYSNVDDRLPTSEAMAKNDCSDLVTAGFYTEEFEHIGLLVSQYNLVSEARTNLNSSGYFFINSEDSPIISQIRPQNPRLAVQSYPLLITDGTARNINNTSQDFARRIVAAVTDKGQVVFIVIYKSDSVFEGPTLAELPELLIDYQENENLQFTDAINLDGGAHSAIISRFIKLPEISTVGGYFCMRY